MRQKSGTGTPERPLALSIVDGGQKREVRLGADLAAGERPQAVVPAGGWQQAQSLGAWTLVGCTVAPGFEFSGFELAPPGVRSELLEAVSQHRLVHASRHPHDVPNALARLSLC